MSITPRLSLGLPVYNGGAYLAESIASLLDQSYEDFELLISDNASTDDTADVCRSYARQDRRIRYIRQRENIGLCRNHNFLVDRAKGELFKWTSADDLYGRDLLLRCVEALDTHPDVVLAHAWNAVIDDDGQLTQSMEYPLRTDAPHAPARFRSFLFGCSGLFPGPDGKLVRYNNDGILAGV